MHSADGTASLQDRGAIPAAPAPLMKQKNLVSELYVSRQAGNVMSHSDDCCQNEIVRIYARADGQKASQTKIWRSYFRL